MFHQVNVEVNLADSITLVETVHTLKMIHQR